MLHLPHGLLGLLWPVIHELQAPEDNDMEPCHVDAGLQTGPDFKGFQDNSSHGLDWDTGHGTSAEWRRLSPPQAATA